MGVDAEKAIREAKESDRAVYRRIREAAEWFHGREGNTFEREEAERMVSSDMGVDDGLASTLVENLVSDAVDPVVQIGGSGRRLVGVIKYDEFDTGYIYLDHHDVKGPQKKAVCATCIHQKGRDTEVETAVDTEVEDTGSPDFSRVKQEIRSHHQKQHDEAPEVVTGATLAAGTTVGGNRVATRSWVENNAGTDNLVTNGNTIYVSNNQPSGASNGDIWINNS
jgi:hypothetical protein